MERIKLSIHHLHMWVAGEKQDAQATARIYAGDTLIVVETMQGQAAWYDRFIQSADDNGQPLRVEWECDGEASMTVSRVEVCSCCGGDESLHV
ncbi:hypothetical protein BS639_16285 [Rouxiella silvae]|uniref:Uncharacterized protein n=1 Tax=Rouxiella silvae TaxID=1646373 RepID=A0AA41BV54_9GAMM|nr:hypothetical protein [Rouxiella silvae]MBF6635760.1 hypothetical protein [Rouxiella silvae]ORJ20221.1 hypothetical protein BS639_16285 [Rouxiella silvae]